MNVSWYCNIFSFTSIRFDSILLSLSRTQNNNTEKERTIPITYLLQRINDMSNFHPFFIPFSKLNGKKCLTHNLQNFTGKFHITLEGVLICSAEYNGLEEDLEQVFDSLGLNESNRQLIRGIVLESSPVTVVVNDKEATVVAAATAAAAADGFNGEPMHVAQGMLTHPNTETYKIVNGGNGNDSTDGDYEEVD